MSEGRPEYLVRVDAIAREVADRKAEQKRLMRTDMPDTAAMIDEFSRVFGRPAWIDMVESGKRITAGKKGWFRRHQEHQTPIPGERTQREWKI